MSVEVRPLGHADRATWEKLHDAYLTFYESEMSDHDKQHLWAVLTAGDGPMFGLGAFVDGELVGITHYTFHASSWAPGGYCYLEDLFTSPAARGSGVGRSLIYAVRDRASERGAARLYWHTQNGNAQARTLYDKVATEAGFVQYRVPL